MKFAKKSLGQNFLTDKNIIRKILNTTKIQDRDIIEIGPGKGALTDEIFKRRPKSLSIIEKDSNLAKDLRLKYSKNKKIKIYCNDVLEFNIEKIYLKNSVIFGNLPYNISSQIFVKILRSKKWPPNFTDLILMFQKEMADKIIAKFTTKNYGRLAILSNLRLKTLNKFLVSPNCFTPKPKVISAVIHFQPKKNHLFNIKNIQNLEKVTNVLFSNKRKMINKNIKKILNKNELKKISNLSLNARPSDIKPEIYYNITEILEKK